MTLMTLYGTTAKIIWEPIRIINILPSVDPASHCHNPHIVCLDMLQGPTYLSFHSEVSYIYPPLNKSHWSVEVINSEITSLTSVEYG